ncbi:hypothetical protein [Oscillibacter ruminantium]
MERAMEGAASKNFPKALRYFLFWGIVTVFSLVAAVLYCSSHFVSSLYG